MNWKPVAQDRKVIQDHKGRKVNLDRKGIQVPQELMVSMVPPDHKV
jgi:hypothetical protein